LPKIIQFKIQLTVELDSFRSREFLFVDPIYELLWSLFFVGYFHDFEVKKYPFGILYSFVEGFPVL